MHIRTTLAAALAALALAATPAFAEQYDWTRFKGPGSPSEQLASIERCQYTTAPGMYASAIVAFNLRLEGESLSAREKAVRFASEEQFEASCIFVNVAGATGRKRLVIRTAGTDYIITRDRVVAVGELDGAADDELLTEDGRHELVPATDTTS
jgi:hypothetical protein